MFVAGILIDGLLRKSMERPGDSGGIDDYEEGMPVFAEQGGRMRNVGGRSFAIVLTVLVVMGGVCPVVFSSDEKTITGKVNATFQIIMDSGETYEVAENELGDEVVELIGKKVKATGTIEIEEGKKTITITGYDVIEE